MDGNLIDESQSYQCCFCGKEVEDRGVEPILLTVVLENDAEQNLYCHADCLRRVLHPSVPLTIG
jgi:hypothetical protein